MTSESRGVTIWLLGLARAVGPARAVVAIVLLASAANTAVAADGAFLQAGNQVAEGENEVAGEEEEVDDGQPQANVFPPPDRATLRLLDKAQQLLDQGRYAEGIRCLGAIFDTPQDYFFRSTPNDSGPRSLKSEAERILGSMSRRGRELYELQYGARARQMLTQAAAAGDASELAEVSRRFFHTQAGYEATLLLGIDHLDHGRPLVGALTLERLQQASPTVTHFEPTLSLALATCWLQAKVADKAEAALLALKERDPGETVEIAGQEVTFFGDDVNPVDWLTRLIGPQTAVVEDLDQWAMFHGDATRSASSSGDGPLLSLRWRVPTSHRPDVEALIQRVDRQHEDYGKTVMPGVHPLVINDVVLMRTACNLLAVDLLTGKRIWEVPIAQPDPFDSLLSPISNSTLRQTTQLEHALRLRMWADATYGTISSDGQRVFSVEDLGLEVSLVQFQAGLINGRESAEPIGPRPYNRLAAYDVITGKLQWELGGSERFSLPQAGAFFLGPPLPLMGRLYVLAEITGEVRLMVLDAKSGELIWSQQLAAADQDILRDPLRRMAGISPSYADGILVCPTSNRAIVAVQLATRSLLWGYTYPQADSRSQRQFAFFGARSVVAPEPSDRWIDSSLVLADGCVLATPVESDHLHCLGLLDGKLRWKEPRGDDLYLACVHGGKAVLVGKQRVRTLHLHETLDGEARKQPVEGFRQLEEIVPEEEGYQRPAPAWDGRGFEFASGVAPSGMGFLSGDLYYAPLGSAEVVAVDLNDGRVKRVYKSRSGDVPGNLVCCKGRIISQDSVKVDAFFQLEPLRSEVRQRLEARADDPEALVLRGEILWDEGKIEEAVNCFRRSLQLRPNPNTRELLRESLFEGLESRFAAHKDAAAEIEQLIEQPRQQATYLRLMATGLADAGEYRPALEQYLKLIELDRRHQGMERLDKRLAVRRDRWVQLRLAELRTTVPPGVRNEIDQMVGDKFTAAIEEEGPQALARFIKYFDGHPIADEARRELVRRHRESGQLLSAELLLAREQCSDDPKVVGSAVAQLAEMLQRAGRSADAANCYERLRAEFADVVCREGETGRELIEAIPPNDPIRDSIRPQSSWPLGEVQITKGDPVMAVSRAPLLFHGDRGPFYSGMTVDLRQNPPQLVGCDDLGAERWHLSLAELLEQGDFSFGQGLSRVSVFGHLLFLSGVQKIAAIDTLALAADGSAKLLWSQGVDESGFDPYDQGQFRIQFGNPPLHPFGLLGRGQDPINVPRVFGERLVCLKRFGDCIALDPMTGETIWIRENVRRDSEVFGDQQYIFIVPPGETKATVLRASDGTNLGQRDVPLQRQRTLGRLVLAWRDAAHSRVLELIDPWEGRPLWPSREFSRGAILRLVENEAAAVYEPDGRFLLVNLADGRTIVDTQLGSESSLPEILVLRSPGQYVVIRYNRDTPSFSGGRISEIYGVSSVRVSRASVLAFDTEGNQLWQSPVEVKDQWLPLNQPAGLPVLTFACKVDDTTPPNARPQPKASILCLDKRTGREICREEFPDSANTLCFVGDSQKKTVDLQFRKLTIRLTFTDKPLPETEEGRDDSTKETSKTEGPASTTYAIFKAIRNAVLGEPSNSAEQEEGRPPSQPDRK